MTHLHALSRSRGYFLRREALAEGVDDRRLYVGLRNGSLVRIRQGAYCPADVWQELSFADQHLARAGATYDLTPGDVALSHVSALALYQCPLWQAPLNQVHLSRLDGACARREAGVVHHRRALEEGDVHELNGRLVTAPTRTTLDALTLMSIDSGMVSGDAMINRGLTTIDDLYATKMAINSWPNTRILEITLRLLDGLSESPGETRSRHLFWRMHLPRPTLQVKIFDDQGHLVAVCDFGWPELGVYGEFDGRIKYGRLLKRGQQPGDVVFEEKQREDAIRRATGGTMVRFTWHDLHAASP